MTHTIRILNEKFTLFRMTAQGCKLRIGIIVGDRFWVSLSTEEYNLLKIHTLY